MPRDENSPPLASGGGGKWPKDGSVPDYVQHWIDWLLTPKAERGDLQTLEQYCASVNLSPDTTRSWRARNRVRQAINRTADEMNLKPERIQRVIDAMFKAAEQGDTKAAMLVLQYADKLQPKRIIIEDRTLSGMSDEDLRNQLAAAGMLSHDPDD
jgi:integrase